MKIERPRLLEIIKEEIDWVKTRAPQGTVNEAAGIDSLIRKHQNNAKGTAMGLLDAAKEFAQMPSHEPASSVASFVEKQANLIVDAMVAIEKLLDETQQATSPLQEEQEEEDPWQKLAGVIQEAEIDPETGKYPPPPEIPDPPSIPQDASTQLKVIEFIEDIAGLTMKGSDFISRRAKELLAMIEGGGALQEEQEEEDPWQKLAGVIQEAEPPFPPGVPSIPDPPSIPQDVDTQLKVIEFIEDIAGLTMTGSDFISRRA